MGLADLLGLAGGIPQPDLAADAPMSMDVPLVSSMQGVQQPDIPQIQQPRHGLLSGSGGIRDFLGFLGDALLVSSGHAPIYQTRMRQKKLGSALSQYLGSSDPMLASIFETDPETGLALYKMQHPASEIPQGVKEFQYYNKMQGPERTAFEKFLQLTHPTMGAPVTLGPTDTIEYPGGSGGGGAPSDVPTVSSAQEAISKYPPGTIVQSPDGRKFKVPGGPTAAPSGNFP
jgi:hypothetical protein